MTHLGNKNRVGEEKFTRQHEWSLKEGLSLRITPIPPSAEAISNTKQK